MPRPNSNSARLLVDGPAALTAILTCIRKARYTIRIRMFMWRDDASGRRVLVALERKIREQPKIKIFIEKDAFGSRVYNFQKLISWGRVGGDIFSAPVGLAFLRRKRNVVFRYIGSRSLVLFKILRENDHSKVLLFDEDTSYARALVGGMNLADEYLTPQNFSAPERGGWHDYFVLVTGKLASAFATRSSGKGKLWLTKKIWQGAEILGNVRSRRVIRQEILRELSRARHSIIVEHAYLTDYAIIRQLRRLARRGVRVNVILPRYSDGVRHANMHGIYKLLKLVPFTRQRHRNLKVYLYHGFIHAKAIVIDGETAILGSANLTGGSFDLLEETNAIFRRHAVTRSLIQQIQKDLRRSTLVTLANIPPYKIWLAWLEKVFI